MENSATNLLTNWTEGLSFFWGIMMIIAAATIFVLPELRQKVLKIFSQNYLRYSVAVVCFVVAVVHLFFYQHLQGGEDLVLLIIGYAAGVKGILFLVFPAFLKISEKILISEYMSGWILIIVALGVYLLNQALHFVTI